MLAFIPFTARVTVCNKKIATMEISKNPSPHNHRNNAVQSAVNIYMCLYEIWRLWRVCSIYAKVLLRRECTLSTKVLEGVLCRLELLKGVRLEAV